MGIYKRRELDPERGGERVSIHSTALAEPRARGRAPPSLPFLALVRVALHLDCDVDVEDTGRPVVSTVTPAELCFSAGGRGWPCVG